MKYELELHESPAAGIKRIITEQVSSVHQLMVDPQPTREDAVHDARKSFKRIRAALRLARVETGQSWYRRENVFYRDSSRLISPVRDSTVLVLTLDAVTEAYADIVPLQTFDSIRQSLELRHEAIVHDLLTKQDMMAAVARRMEEGLERLLKMPAYSDEFGIYADGLQRVYRRGHRAMQRAYADAQDPANFHEWRKRVKYLWHHIEILQPAWPLMLGDLANELHLLSDFLGDAHDLVVLKETLLAEPALSEGNQNLVTLLALIDRRRRVLEEASSTVGQRLYSERPEAFVRRIQTYWDTWQVDTPAARAALQRSWQEKTEVDAFGEELPDDSSA